MAKKTPTISEQLLQAIEDCDLSVQAIARGSEIAQPILCRFANGTRSINIETANKLARFFEMRLTKPVQPKA